MPKISIVVPIYKVEKYIKQCINSILNQTYQDYLLVLVDDGSPDRCGYICDTFAQKYNNVIVIHQKNAGLSAARNAGIDWTINNSNCKWITFIDSDDWVHPQYLEILYKAAIDNNVRISMCDGILTKKREMEIEKVENVVWEKMISYISYEKRYGTCMIACCKLFDIALFEKFHFPIGKLHEDAFIIYKIVFEVEYVSIIDTPLYFYFYNSEGITHSSWNVRRLDEIEAHEQQLQFLFTNNYINAYKGELDAYIHVLSCQLKEMPSEPNYKIYHKIILKKLRRAIRLLRKCCTKEIKGYEWIYELAFPNFMRIYWIITAFHRRIYDK